MRFAILMVVLMASLPQVALANGQNWTIKIDVAVNAKMVVYSASATDFTFGPKYKATIYAMGSAMDVPPHVPVAASLREIAQQKNSGLVLNGGYSDFAPFQPQGLLLVKGSVLNPLSTQSRHDHRFLVLSEVLCQSKASKLSLIDTEEFISNKRSILGSCSSAIQAGPAILANGANGIEGDDLIKRQPAVRTCIGFDKKGNLHVIFFPKPIHLYAAGEFMRAPPKAIGQSIIADDATGHIAVTSGLGLKDVMNLSGAAYSIYFEDGKLGLGSPNQTEPSAIQIRTQ